MNYEEKRNFFNTLHDRLQTEGQITLSLTEEDKIYEINRLLSQARAVYHFPLDIKEQHNYDEPIHRFFIRRRSFLPSPNIWNSFYDKVKEFDEYLRPKLKEGEAIQIRLEIHESMEFYTRVLFECKLPPHRLRFFNRGSKRESAPPIIAIIPIQTKKATPVEG